MAHWSVIYWVSLIPSQLAECLCDPAMIKTALCTFMFHFIPALQKASGADEPVKFNIRSDESLGHVSERNIFFLLPKGQDAFSIFTRNCKHLQPLCHWMSFA